MTKAQTTAPSTAQNASLGFDSCSFDSHYDVIVIGAGLAGLAAAYQLRDRHILVLEQAVAPGGRVLTRTHDTIAYDLGAVFGYPLNTIPFAFQPAPLIKESTRVGLYVDGQLHLGDSVLACLQPLDLATADLLALEQFPQDPGHSLAQMSPRLRQILNAFFQTIYLGDIGPYRASNQRTALTRQTIDHRAAGNGELVGQFVQRLTQQICTQARVSSVTDEGDGVRVVFAHGDTPGDQPAQTVSNKTVSNKTVFSKSVIVTAPAPITQQLLHTINEPCRSFLQAMRYAPATVVVIGVHGPDLADFSYLATPEGPTAVVMRHRTADPHTNVLFAYFTEDQATALCTLPTEQVVELAVETLTQLSIGLNRGDPLLFTDVQHWTHAAPVITPGIYDQWDARNTRPSPRVFLAGDYVHLDPRKPLPYGMNAAMGSGKAAAQSVRTFLDQNSPYPTLNQHQPADRNQPSRGHTMTYSLRNDDIVVSSPRSPSQTAVHTPRQSPRPPAHLAGNGVSEPVGDRTQEIAPGADALHVNSHDPAIRYLPSATTGHRPVMAFLRHLLDDEQRTGSFIEAIARAVQPGDVVVDMGTGTGILALAACRAGARHVYAIEHGTYVWTAEASARRSGFDERQITFIHGDAWEVNLPEQADLIVSECLGIAGPSGMTRALSILAQRWLKPTGRLIPNTLSTFIAPVESAMHFEYAHIWDRPRYGFDFSPFQQIASNNVYLARFQAEMLLAVPQALATHRLLDEDTAQSHNTFIFEATRDGHLHGFCGWFETDLGSGIMLSSSPAAPPTIWQQTYFPLTQAIPVQAGQTIHLRFELNIDTEPAFCWETATGGVALTQSTDMSEPQRS